jgi:hypothetical protein
VTLIATVVGLRIKDKGSGRKFARGPFLDKTQMFAILEKKRCT